MAKTRRTWSAYELALLQKEYTRRPIAEIARFIGRTLPSVSQKAKQLGLQKGRERIRWEPWMLSILKDNYAHVTNAKLSEWLGVSRLAVSKKARSMCLRKEGKLYRPSRVKADGTSRRIGPAEDSFIRSHAESMSIAAIAKHIGFAKCSVSVYCRRNGIPHEKRGYSSRNPDGSVHRIGENEGTYIRKHLGVLPVKVISQAIGFSITTVYQWCRKNGLNVTRSIIK